MTAGSLAADLVRLLNGNVNRELQAANHANRDGSVRTIPFAAAELARCFCFLEQKGDELRPRRDVAGVAAEQIRGIREIRGWQFKQFKSFVPYSQLRSLAPFSA